LWAFGTRGTISTGSTLRAFGTRGTIYPDYTISTSGTLWTFGTRGTISTSRTLRAFGTRGTIYPVYAIGAVAAHPDLGRYLPGDPGHRDRYHPLIDDRRYLAAGDGDIGGNISHMKYLELL